MRTRVLYNYHVPWTLISDSADLIVECSELAVRLGIDLHAHLSDTPLKRARSIDGSVAIAVIKPLDDSQLLEALELGIQAILVLGKHDNFRGIATDLGLFAPSDIRSLLAGLQLLAYDEPWRASLRSLRTTDRQRLASSSHGDNAADTMQLRYGAEGLLVFHDDTSKQAVTLGEARDVREAFERLRTRGGVAPAMPIVEGLDSQAVTEVLLGPARALSDPASKQALAEYDVPLPEEVLCGSASRAASEASRIGFPVRVSLASPDLRAWDHPDLTAEGVDNAARVREVFRRFSQIAKQRAPSSRVLGVVVSATTTATALIRASFHSIGPGVVVARVGFADPHGLAARDETALVLPCRYHALEMRLRRLRGHGLFLHGSAQMRRTRVEELADVLLRAAAFTDDWRAEVDEVRLHTVALLIGGGAEIREACIVVGDAFTRSLGTDLVS